ncbi:MAG TPA: 50S ribosomal protein L18, partial [Kiritimatiellia bacterium]|nr:50S ribosomal protein L18 [Kiritimatiellia bacterium]
MNNMSFNRKEQRNRRHMRLRQRVKGTAARPRMA